jgi:TldD protein
MILSLIFVLGTALASPPSEPSPSASKTEEILSEELHRAVEVFSKEPEPPYYISLALQETESFSISAWADALETSSEETRRTLDVDLRIGDPELDNTHENYRHMPDGGAGAQLARATSDGDYPLRHAIWQLLDQAFQDSTEAIELVRSRQTTRVEAEVSAPDFSLRGAMVSRVPTEALDLNREEWERRILRASQVLAAHPMVTDSSISLRGQRQVDTFVNTEGTRLHHGRISIRLSLQARTVADDGEKLVVYRSKDVHRLETLESVDLLQWADEALEEIGALREAPRVEPYSGPVILSGKAAGVFIHEVLGHRSEGHRQKLDSEGRTFADQVGEPILPEFIDIVDDPTISRLGGEDLNGTYLFDSEGVPAQPAQLVESGLLVGFLMSRSPIPDFSESNGHGRSQAGKFSTGRMANTILSAHESVSEAELRRMLLDEVRKQGLEFGIIVDDIDGGFTYTSSYRPNSFSILTRTARRIYLDDRPDELVRGIDMVGTPLAAFSELIAAADVPHVFNGRCGAESGWVPVSSTSPNLLFRNLEFQRKGKSALPPPLLDKPSPELASSDVPHLDELRRGLSELSLPDAPPIYFARTQLYRGQSVYAQSQFGSLKYSRVEPYNRLSVELRLGSPEFDNTRGYRQRGFASRTLPLVPTSRTLRLGSWLGTDEAYLEAVEAYAKRAARADREDSAPPSYTLTDPVELILPAPDVVLPESLEFVSQQLTAPFIGSPTFQFAEAYASAGSGDFWIHDSAGTIVRRPASRFSIRVIAGLHAEDGMLIADQRHWLERHPAAMPSPEEMSLEVVAMRDQLIRIAEAPILNDDYIGPVIFEDDAAADLIRFLLLPMLEGTPTEDPNREMDRARRGQVEVQPKTGRRVLPEGWAVHDDPQSREDRPGYVRVDDEGTPTQPVDLVEDGIVRTLYMSRTPRADLDATNGHARGRMGSIAHGRAFQVQVRAPKQVSTHRLLKQGLRQARSYGLDYVLIVRRLQDPSARKLHYEARIPMPLAVIKHYADGREELYRGASFVDISPFLLRDIRAAGPQQELSYLASWSPGSNRVSTSAGLDTWISTPTVLIGEMELTPYPGDPENLFLLPPPQASTGHQAEPRSPPAP